MFFVAKVKSIDYLRKFDYTLFLVTCALTLMGLLSVKSATLSMRYGASIYKMQILMSFAGVFVALFINFIDYNLFKSFALYLYGFSVVLLVALLFIGEGADEVGAASWLKIPGLITFQPAEIAKITYILLIALIMEKINEGERGKYIWMLLIFSFVPVVLIFKQPDAGTAIAFMMILLVMIFINGIRYRYILITGGICGALLPVVWKFVLHPYQKKRVLSLFYPELQSADDLYQINKAKTAISSGQIFGQGLFKGIQTQNNGIPVKESDFIFSVIGEELGFIGVGLIMLLFAILIIRIFYVAATADDMYGSFIAAGIGAVYMYHFIENVGMNIGLLPITGIPLPFVSAGGSALLTNFIALGIALSISLRRRDGMFEKPNI